MRLHAADEPDVVLTGVWITTGGTLYNEVAKYIGEELHTCMQQTGNACRKPVLLGFANLRDVTAGNKIKQQSHSIDNLVKKVQVCWRSFDRTTDRLIISFFPSLEVSKRTFSFT